MPTVLVTLTAILVLPLVAAGQTPPAAKPTNVEVEPVTCWWRTSVSSVRMGEPFNLRLTCSILEAEAARAVIDRTRLAPAAVQLPPFEIISGSQGEDLVRAGRRFFQHEYTMRLIGEDQFGAEVPIPALQIPYRIESRVEQDRSLQGREQTYLMPTLSMKIASLVSSDATHIREAPAPALSEIAARDARGSLFRAVGAVLIGVGALVVLVAFARRVAERRKATGIVGPRLLTSGSVIAAAKRELAAVRTEAQGGWTPDLAARALAALRIIASFAVNHAITQRVVDGKEVPRGELLVRSAVPPRRAMLVTGAATAAHLASDPRYDELREALTLLTVARYGRVGTLDASALEDAIAAGARAADRVAQDHGWVAETWRGIRRQPRLRRAA
jgi:hypothetical protein